MCIDKTSLKVMVSYFIKEITRNYCAKKILKIKILRFI